MPKVIIAAEVNAPLACLLEIFISGLLLKSLTGHWDVAHHCRHCAVEKG